MKGLRKVGTAFAVAGSSALMLVAGSAQAADGWDYSSLTSGIDFSTIGVGVLAVAGLLAAVYAGIKGARIILGFLRS